jgi:hypothetical protein
MVLAAVMAAALVQLPGVVRAASGIKPTELYMKVPTVTVEFWDQNGLFHMVLVELTAVFPLEQKNAKLDKKLGERIGNTLAAMPWEEFSRGNPAATAKAVALDMIRKDPGGETCTEVLISRLVIR